MPRTIFAFNGDLESRLALHWLVHERAHEVITLSLNLGQEQYLEPLGELALELGAAAARIVDRRTEFLRDFAVPVLQADAVYQNGCFLGSALARFVIARELVRLGTRTELHQRGPCLGHQGQRSGPSRRLHRRPRSGPGSHRPRRLWNLRTLEDKRTYAHRRRLPLDESVGAAVTVDRNLWGASIYVAGLTDPWEEPAPEVFVLTRAPNRRPTNP